MTPGSTLSWGEPGPVLALALLFITLCGSTIVGRVFPGSGRFFSAVMGCSVGLCLYLQMVNGLEMLGGATPTAAPLGLAVLLGVALLCRFRLKRVAGEDLPLGAEIALWTALGTIFLLSAMAHNRSGDDDFWIHAPLQGLLARGGLPVTHPFFSDIQMNGHYGRDLLIAALAELTHNTVIYIESWLTPLLQALAFTTLWLAGWRFQRSYWAATAMSLQVFLAINVGGRMGHLDCYQNNNALVYLMVCMLAIMILESIPSGRKPALILCGTLVGGLAIVYESHCGLVTLATVSLLFYWGLTTDVPRIDLARRAGLILLLGGLLAATQGGPITHLVKNRLSGKASEASHLSAGEMNQRQVLPITFPKSNLFQIKLAWGNYQRISQAYETFPWLASLNVVEGGPAYHSIWSWQVLKIHWLSTLLAPLSLPLLWRRRSALGLFFLSFGLYSYLTPALVDFGPIYEFEYYRWEYGAGFGFAAAVGLSLGLALETLWLGSGRARVLLPLIVALWTYLNVYPSYHFFLAPLRNFLTEQGPQALIPWSTGQSVRMNRSVNGTDPLDMTAGLWLRSQSQPGQRMLMNFPDFGPFAIMLESTMVSLSGVASVGHAYPLENDPVGTPPYHMSSSARAFWGNPDPAILEQLGVDWIVLRPGQEARPQLLEGLKRLPGVSLVRQDGAYYFYRVDRGGHSSPAVAVDNPTIHLMGPLPWARRQPAALASGVCYEAPISWSPPTGQDATVYYSFVSPGNPDKVEPLSLVPFTLKAGETWRILPLVVPLEAGTWKLRFWTMAGSKPVPLQEQPDLLIENGR